MAAIAGDREGRCFVRAALAAIEKYSQVGIRATASRAGVGADLAATVLSLVSERGAHRFDVGAYLAATASQSVVELVWERP